MNIEPEISKERRALKRIRSASHPVMRIAPPGLLIAGVFLSTIAIRDMVNGHTNLLAILFAPIFLYQAWTTWLILGERRAMGSILKRLEEKKEEKDS